MYICVYIYIFMSECESFCIYIFLSSRSANGQDAVSSQITAIVSYSKGFACTCGLGTVFLFEKTDDRDYFKKTREVKARERLCTVFNVKRYMKSKPIH